MVAGACCSRRCKFNAQIWILPQPRVVFFMPGSTISEAFGMLGGLGFRKDTILGYRFAVLPAGRKSKSPPPSENQHIVVAVDG